MTWHLHSVTFRLLSPVHAGSLPVGNILKTKPYVSGKVLWGAVTEALVRHGYAPANPAGYRKTGQSVCQFLRFGYFFPVTQQGAPRLPAQDFRSQDLFEYEFLDTYSSTAINSEANSAEPNSLHEIEVIRPCTRPLGSEPEKQVCLAGHLLTHENCPADLFNSARAVLSTLQIGGKRGYGFGRIVLETFEDSDQIHRAVFDSDGSVTLPAGQPCAAHITMSAGMANPVHAMQEPFLGREWREDVGFGAGQFISEPRFCYAPGAIFDSPQSFQLGQLGIWEAKAAA